MKLTEISKDSNYKITQFNQNKIDRLEKNIIVEKVRYKDTPFVNCIGKNNKKTAAQR